MTYKEDMKFQKQLSLWDWQSSGVSVRNEFRRSMAPNFPWKCAKKKKKKKKEKASNCYTN